MQLRIGTSAHAETRAAVADAARVALAGCGSPALALVFSTYEYPADAVAEAVNAELGAVPWAGAVTPAILAGREVVPRGIAIGVIDSDRVRVRVGAAGPVSGDAREA